MWRRFSQALQRVKQPLFSLSRASDPEIALVGLCHVCLLVQQTPYAFSDDYQQFFVRHSDAAYVKQKKIDVLKHLATESNQLVLVNELMEYTKVRAAPPPPRSLLEICMSQCKAATWARAA